MGQTIQKQEDAAEYSELKRKVDEAGFATFNAATGDEEADAKLWDTFEQDLAALQSKRANVNNALQRYTNSVLPDWQNSFAKKGLAVRRKNVRDKFELEAENLLGKGNLPEYYKQLNTRLVLQDISQAEFDFKVANAPNDSILQQMRMQIGNNNPQGAIELSEQMKDPTADQMEDRDRLLARVDKLNKENLETTHQEYWQLLQAGDFDTLEAKINDPTNPLPVTGDGGKNWWRKLIAKREEDLVQTDQKIQAKIADAIIFEPHTIDPRAIRNYAGKGAKGGLSLDKVEEYENKYNLAMDKTSALNTPLAKTFFSELKDAETDRAFSIDKIKNNIIYGQSLDSLTDFFVDFREKNKRDPTLAETQEFYQNLISGYRTPERPFTDAKIQQTVGEIQSGGAVSIFGTVMPFSRPEDAINHMLRNLGPNWQKIAPEAAKIIKRKWPEAKVDVIKITKPQEFEIGQRIIHTDGNPYEYRPDGAEDQQPWKPVE